MKKVWILAVILAFVLAFTACGGNNVPEPPAPPAVETPAPPTPAPPTPEPPAEDEPVEDEPAEDEPAEDEPAEDEPAEDEPAEDEPAEDEPAEDEPVEDEPVEDEPAEEPVEDEPVEEEPVATPAPPAPPAAALPAGTVYNLGPFTAPHNWAPGWSTDGRNDNSYPLQMATLQAASHLVVEFSDNPETAIELTLMSDGNSWSWTQVPVWDSDDVDWETVLAAGNYNVVINLATVEGWGEFISSGPAHLGVGGLGGNDAVTEGVFLILN